MKLSHSKLSNQLLQPLATSVITQSLIDQITPQILMPFCVFYPQDRRANLSNLELCDRIKKSLSEVLTLFYPLARCVKVNLYIDCNDEGILYLEYKANCQLSEFLENPIPAELDKFLPIQALAIQVTTFNCGRVVMRCGSIKKQNTSTFKKQETKHVFF